MNDIKQAIKDKINSELGGDDKLQEEVNSLKKSVNRDDLNLIVEHAVLHINDNPKPRELNFPEDFLPSDGYCTLGDKNVYVSWGHNHIEDTILGKPKEDFIKAIDRVNDLENGSKSEQAYKVLESLDYEYDQAKQLWYKKTFIAGV